MLNSPRVSKTRRPDRRPLASCVAAVVALAVIAFSPRTPAASAQTIGGSPTFVISQIYTHGGEPGAAFRNDYVELFNRGNQPVDIKDWALHLALNTSPYPTTWYIRLTLGSYVVQPGRYVLVKLGGGPNGAPLPGHDFNANFPLLPFPPELTHSGTVGLLDANGNFRGCPTLGTQGVVDYVGYGPGSTCFEGLDGAAAEPSATQAAVRDAGGCSDNNSSKLDFRLGTAAPRNSSTPAAPCNIPDPPSFFDFDAPEFHAAESDGRAEILVTRTGDLTAPATVDYSVTGGTASDRGDYTSFSGRLRFATGEARKTFEILLTDDATQEPGETVEMLLWKPAGGGAVTGLRDRAALVIHDDDFGPAASNPIDSSEFFVRQHYHDFLNREPDPAGLQFWTGGIESCGADAGCREVKRIDTSAAFFLSIEFQRTGFLVHRLYRASLPEKDYRVRSLPRYLEFVRDTREVGRGVVVGRAGWEWQLQQNIDLFLQDFMARPEFVLAYPPQLDSVQYVDKLNAQAGGVLTPTERTSLAGSLALGGETRATVLRKKVAENAEFSRRETNRAFVLMQYFGYLRRAPNDPPDADFAGLDFWLTKLDSFGGDYRRAEMVKAFLSSAEYRARFGQ
ncbi:MAG TPA: DUF4214 domain-containing protein [Pyrinomonadaceae bacterium]|jgi:hypothetical protein